MIGLRASSGRVSMMPVIVSGSPTMIIAGSSMLVGLARLSSALMFGSLVAVVATDADAAAVVVVLWRGTGGASPAGTSNSQVVTFSELRDTTAVGFSDRFTEPSAKHGDVLRGGNGGAVRLSFAFSASVAICVLLGVALIMAAGV